MSDEKNRFGDTLHNLEKAREDQWAHQRDDELIEKLRQKYRKQIHCLECGAALDPRAAIGFGGMVCPHRHGAWLDRETLAAARKRYENAAAAQGLNLGAILAHDLEDLVAAMRKKHAQAIKCPECGSVLEARTALELGGMACPNHHGAWLDWETLQRIRGRLEAAAQQAARAKK